MATTSSTVKTTDTLETFRVQFNNLRTDVVSIDQEGSDNVIISDGGYIGSVSDTDAMSISTTGTVTFTQAPNFTSGIAITSLDIDGGTDIGAAITDADLFIIDDGAGGTNRKVAASRIKTYAGSVAYDDISAGDAAFSVATTAGNITIDAQGDDTDIILKGTDGTVDTTFLTVDGSEAGKATFNNEIVSGALITSGAGLKIADAGNIGSASDPDAIAISAGGDVSLTGGGLSIIDQEKVILGTNSDISLSYDETTTDSLVISSDVNDAALGIILQADAGADAGDEWKLNIANAGVLTLGNDIASAGTHTTLYTITPNSTTASTAHAFIGTTSSSVGIHAPQLSADSISIPVTLDSTDGSANAGDNIVMEAGNTGNENDRILYEDTIFDSVATMSSHGVTLVGTRIETSGASSADVFALTDAVVIDVDFGANQNFSVTLAGNRTIGNPTNIVVGQSGSIIITQDGTGSRTLAYSTYWHFAGGTAPTLTTTASAIDRIDYVVASATSIHAVASLDVKTTS